MQQMITNEQTENNRQSFRHGNKRKEAYNIERNKTLITKTLKIID